MIYFPLPDGLLFLGLFVASKSFNDLCVSLCVCFQGFKWKCDVYLIANWSFISLFLTAASVFGQPAAAAVADSREL